MARYAELPLCFVLLATLHVPAPYFAEVSGKTIHILTIENAGGTRIEGETNTKTLQEKDGCQVLLVGGFTPTVSSQLAIANFSPSHEVFLRLPLALAYSQTVSSRL